MSPADEQASRSVHHALATNHQRAGFQCGVNALDDYLHKDVKRRVSRVFVATTLEQPDVIRGYYTLSSLSIEFDQLPEKLARRLPHHPLPATLLGRLAISQDAQGRGIGGLLLADAIKRTLAVSNQIAIYALVVDVIDDQVRDSTSNTGSCRLVRIAVAYSCHCNPFNHSPDRNAPVGSAHTKSHRFVLAGSDQRKKLRWGKKWGKNRKPSKTIRHKKIQSPLSDWIS